MSTLDVITNIEAWTNKAALQQHGELTKTEADAQSRNKGWWEAFPMTYECWDAKDRLPATLADFAKVDASYFETNPYLKTAVDFAAWKGKRVLEIGCGAGSAACRFAENGAIVTAVDLTEQAVALCRKHAELKGLKMEVLQADAEHLAGLTDGRFDFVYSWGVLHHSSNPSAAYRQVARVLKPSGSWLLMVYHRNSLRYWVKGLYHLLGRGQIFRGESLDTVQRFFTDGYFHKHYSRGGFAKTLAQAGLQPKGTEVTHMSSRMIPAIPERLRQALKRRIGWLLVARG